MKRLFVAVVLACAFPLGPIATAQEKAPESVEGATVVDAAEAKALFDRDVKFVDVREARLYDAGRIPGAVLLAFFKEFNEDNLLALADKSDEVVIYCEGPG